MGMKIILLAGALLPNLRFQGDPHFRHTPNMDDHTSASLALGHPLGSWIK